MVITAPVNAMRIQRLAARSPPARRRPARAAEDRDSLDNPRTVPILGSRRPARPAT